MDDTGPSTMTVGDLLPTVHLHISYARVIHNTGAGRDYMRGHHEPEFARSQGVPTIYMNTLFHQAFVDRVVAEWAGPASFLVRRNLRMQGPICAGDTIASEARIVALHEDDAGRPLVDITVTVRNERNVCCIAECTVRLPQRR